MRKKKRQKDNAITEVAILRLRAPMVVVGTCPFAWCGTAMTMLAGPDVRPKGE